MDESTVDVKVTKDEVLAVEKEPKTIQPSCVSNAESKP